MKSLIASFLLGCAVCISSAAAQVSFPPGSYGLWSSSTQLSTRTSSCQPTPANGLKLIQNRGAVGILLSVGWQDVETADGVFDWSQVDARIQEAAVCGLAVEMSLVIGLWHTPDWLLDPSYGIQTINLINQNKYQADCGAAHVTPVYWDATLQSYRIRFITEAANRYAGYGNLVAVIANPMGSSNDDWSVPSSIGSVTCLAGPHSGQTIPFNNLQPWLDAGYNPAQEQPSSLVFNAAIAIIDATAAAFPLQSIKLPIQVTHELLDGTKTALAEAVLN